MTLSALHLIAPAASTTMDATRERLEAMTASMPIAAEQGEPVIGRAACSLLRSSAKIETGHIAEQGRGIE
jgi:hypothetical protein